MASPTNGPFPPVISYDRSAAGPGGLGAVDGEGAARDVAALSVPSPREQAEARIAMTAQVASAARSVRL